MSEYDETPYVIVERRGSNLGAFLGGAVIGAIVALLYAPKTGEETQADLKDGLRRLRTDAEDKLGQAKNGTVYHDTSGFRYCWLRPSAVPSASASRQQAKLEEKTLIQLIRGYLQWKFPY